MKVVHQEGSDVLEEGGTETSRLVQPHDDAVGWMSSLPKWKLRGLKFNSVC